MVEITVTQEQLDANPEWVKAKIEVGDTLEVPESEVPKPQVTEEVTKKEVVTSKSGRTVSEKATIRKAKENQKVIEKNLAPLGGSAKYKVLTRINMNGVVSEIGEKVTLVDNLATRRLLEIKCIESI